MPASTRPRDRRLATLLGGAALVGATATMAVAAQTSLPGESLYGVKRGIESAEVRLAGDDATRGRTLLAQAETRLTELEELAAGAGGAEQLIPDTLDTFTEQSGEGVRSLLTSYGSGGSDADVEVARAFTSSSMDRLDALQGQLPESASDELLAAGRTLTDLDTEITTACGLCDGALTVTPDFLLTTAAPDLVQGLDTDEVTLEAAPLSGQDVSGITIPKALQSPDGPLPTDGATPTQVVPTTTPTTLVPGTPTPSPTTPPKVDPTKPVKDITTDLTGTTSTLTTQLDGVTGGAVGGLTGAVDDATGGLIGEVTGTVDGATGGLLGNATGGLLP